MADFQFLRNPVTKKWIIWAPRRSKRMNVGVKAEPLCPFCIGREGDSPELYRVGGTEGDPNWHIRVTTNKFPFAPHHELVIHSPDHHKNFDELPFSQVELIVQTYRARYLANEKNGQVYIFHNRGYGAGESVPHPHTQIAVIPDSVQMEIPSLDLGIYNSDFSFDTKIRNSNIEIRNNVQNTNIQNSKRFDHSIFGNLNLFRISDFVLRALFNKQQAKDNKLPTLETEHFLIFCPATSEWPDEVWVAPKQQGRTFGTATDTELKDLAFIMSRLIHIMDYRHGREFSFNFYIYPGSNWYFRLVPRVKVLGGFEVGTKIIVNTHNPSETMAFLNEHFWEPDIEKIKGEHQADYWKSV